LIWVLELAKQFLWRPVRVLTLLVLVRDMEERKKGGEQTERGATWDTGRCTGRCFSHSSSTSLVAEINPTLLAISQASRLFSRTNPGTARFSSSNLLTLPYSSFDVIFLFGVKPLLSQLEPKLINEVKPSGHLLLYRFTLPATAAYNDKYEILERDGEMTLYRRVVEQT
jgi:hypothetical protein